MENLTSLILAGGKGTRIQGLHPQLPKALVPVAGKPFLHWLLVWLGEQGLRDFVFSLGHRGGAIEAWLGTAEAAKIPRWRAFREKTPLGTGGGARACLAFCGDTILVMNGDSLLLAPLEPALRLLEDRALDGVVFGIPMKDASRYGTLTADPNGRLISFREKQPDAGLINAGIYLLRKAALEVFPENCTLSMEYDVIPQMLAAGRQLAVHRVAEHAPFIDIGTPESLALADDFVRRNFLKTV